MDNYFVIRLSDEDKARAVSDWDWENPVHFSPADVEFSSGLRALVEWGILILILHEIWIIDRVVGARYSADGTIRVKIEDWA